MFADISHGHALAADWLLLIAAVVFVLASLTLSVDALSKLETRIRLVPLGLVLVAVALLVLL